jgi:hypothetical protein
MNSGYNSIFDIEDEIEVNIVKEFNDELCECKNRIDYKDEYDMLYIKFSSLLKYTESLYNENINLKCHNLTLKSRLSSTSNNLAEKEKMFLLLKSFYNNKWKK